MTGMAEELLWKAGLSPRGAFCLERGAGFVYDLISSNSRLSPKPAAHFVLEFCTNMYIPLNMKMTVTATDLRKQPVP